MVSNEQAIAFYKSSVWQKCRAYILSRDDYLCQECLVTVGPVPADTVHHIIHLKDDWEKRLDPDNLISVCASCHNKLHPEKSNKKNKEKINNKIKEKRIKVVQMKSNPEIF